MLMKKYKEIVKNNPTLYLITCDERINEKCEKSFAFKVNPINKYNVSLIVNKNDERIVIETYVDGYRHAERLNSLVFEKEEDAQRIVAACYQSLKIFNPNKIKDDVEEKDRLSPRIAHFNVQYGTKKERKEDQNGNKKE